MGRGAPGWVSNARGCRGDGSGFPRRRLGERWLLPLPFLPPPWGFGPPGRVRGELGQHPNVTRA